MTTIVHSACMAALVNAVWSDAPHRDATAIVRSVRREKRDGPGYCCRFCGIEKDRVLVIVAILTAMYARA